VLRAEVLDVEHTALDVEHTALDVEHTALPTCTITQDI